MQNRSGIFSNISFDLNHLIVFTLSFYLFKTGFWPLTYLFVISYTFMFALYLLKFKGKFNLVKFVKDFKVALILAIIILLEVIINKDFDNKTALKDILLISVIFSLFYFLHWTSIYNKHSVNEEFIIKLVILIAACICVINLAVQIFPSILSIKYLGSMNLSDGASLANDYNYFSLLIILCLLGLNYKLNKTSFKFRFHWFIRLMLNSLFIVNIILSGSRRGIFGLFIILIFQLFNNHNFSYNIKKIQGFNRNQIFRIATLIIIGFTFIALYRTLPKYKLYHIASRFSYLSGDENNRLFEKIMWKDSPTVKVAGKTLIDSSTLDLTNCYWDSYTAPATILEQVETPHGLGILVTREESDQGGFSLHYCGPKILYYANHTYKISYKIKFIEGDFDSFNVGWWINDGGKGFSNTIALNENIDTLSEGWYSCEAYYTFLDNHVALHGFINSVTENTSFIIADFMMTDEDFDPKLPRFIIETDGNLDIQTLMDSINKPWMTTNLISNGDFSHGMSFWGHSEKSGIEVKHISKDGKNYLMISRGIGDGGGWSLYYMGRDILFKANNTYQVEFKVKTLDPGIMPFNVGFWVNEGGGYVIDLVLNIDTLSDNWLNVKADYSFKSNQKNILFPINSQINNSRFYITDISLTNISNLQYQIPQDSINQKHYNSSWRFAERTTRWMFGLEIWKTKYNLINKLFGKGFGFLGWYGEKYLDNPQLSDWPHNPLVTILLYSGVIGLVLYIYLIYKVITLYLIYKIEYGYAFVGFLITYFFTFFSGSHPFDPPLMGFFILLPFFIHSIHNRKNMEGNEFRLEAKSKTKKDKTL